VSDDFVLQTRQIGQYPKASSVAPADLFLMQQGGLGGPYMSVSGPTILNTALELGGWLKFAPGSGPAWNGATLTWLGGVFAFAGGRLQVESLHSDGDIFVAGEALASQVFVTGLFDVLLENSVWTFNGRKGNVQLESNDILRAGGILATNPHFAGVVTAPTIWNPFDRTDAVATTAFVQNAICNFVSTAQQTGCGLVTSFNGRGGDVVMTANDITIGATQIGQFAQANTAPSGDASKKIATTMFVDNATADLQAWTIEQINQIASELDQQFAPLNSPQFTGIPTAPTAAQTVNSGQLATTAFVHAAVTASTTGVSSWNGRTGAVTLTLADVTSAGGAPIASPAFTGTPTTATTPAPGDNTTKLATTAFVQAAIGGIASGVVSFNTRVGAVTLTAADVTGVGGALLASPTFTGTPSGPTPAPTDNSTHLATTAYVTNAISVLPAPVTSFNGRVGAVSFQASDISAVGGALLAGPIFTGVPTVPTAAVGTSNTQIASTAFVAAAVAAATGGVTSFNTRTGAVTLNSTDVTNAGGALLAGPTFTGVPSAPTATAGTNSTQLATTAFVQAALAAAPGGVSSFNARTGAITLLGSDVSAAGGAMIASPSFTGTPTAPTPAPGANNLQLATTAFVQSALTASGGVSSFNGRAGAVTLAGSDIIGVTGGVLMTVAATAPTGTPATANQALWWDSVRGQLYLNYNDGTSTQWVATNSPQPQTVSGLIAQQVFTASGTYTPTAGMRVAMIECVGGGGGGAGAPVGGTGFHALGCGGGSGGYSRKLATSAAVGASQTVTIGAAGTAGSATPTNGGNGGNTSVGTLCVANGGLGGTILPTTPTAGAGGAPGTGDLTVAGMPGQGGSYLTNNLSPVGTMGGSSVFGGGATGLAYASITTPANAGRNYGGGGGGGLANATTASAGGAGAAGVVIITEYA